MAPTRSRRRSVAHRLVLLVALALVVAACGAEVPTVRPTGSGAGAGPSGSALGAKSSAPSDTGLAACKGTDLKGSIVDWAGGSATRLASVVVTSKSGVTCTLRGRPSVRLVDGAGKIVLDSAKIKGGAGPKVASGDPVVVLGPGDSLAIDVQWTNWCGSQPKRPVTVNLVLTDRGGLLKVAKATTSGDDDAPSCAAKKSPAGLRVTGAWSGPGL